MQTLLSRFCDEFVRIIRPLVVPLNHAVEAMSAATNGVPGKEIQTGLIDLRHQLEVLCNKVGEQQAYVLIFGPLKSGKSTLMNALAASYVSEVTSLPAYPCMIFVSGGQKQEFAVTDYNGKTVIFTDGETFRDYVDRAHAQLADRIRETEALGKQFDPQLHFADAIRKIDVKLPGGDLAGSAAVLVDTPGLYSRMKFGYDRMTREFRDAAACAVFVVRSDNLYLEQVFVEFNKLLELFSKIFLVVNLDTDKKDLQPDGTLAPSLEQENPQRLIEAFENLTMSAPLKKAAEEGRLKIYPIGLLHAASQRLRKNEEKTSGEQGRRDESDFERFRTDLTEYLDSAEYIVSFLSDSLRRAGTLLGDAAQLCGHKDLKVLNNRIQKLESQEKDTLAQLNGIGELDTFNWEKGFSSLQRSLAPILEQRAEDVGKRIAGELTSKVKTWFKTSASLRSLVKGDLVDLFTEYQSELTEALSKELGEKVLQGRAGIAVPDDVAVALRRIGIDLDSIGRDLHKQVDRQALVVVPPTPVRSEHIPVRKGIVDWILFRSAQSVRRRLFGAPDSPSRTIPVDVKSARLGDAAQTAIRERLTSYKRGFFADTVTRIQRDFLGAYCRGARDTVIGAMHDKRSDLKIMLQTVQSEQDTIRELLKPMEDLQKKSAKAQGAIQKLTGHYGEVDMFLLTQPVELPSMPPISPVIVDRTAELEVKASAPRISKPEKD